MRNDFRYLPRLSRVRSFEAAARHLSFLEASRELEVTQAAVSQQVRLMEKELGVPLFIRLHRGLKLTPQGHRLMRSVSSALGQIADAAEVVRAGDSALALKVGVTFAVATFWLIPRLVLFRQLHPEIEIHLIATDRGFETVAPQVDIGIAFGDGTWPGFSSTLFQESVVFPVCSPEYVNKRPHLVGVEQLTRETLLSIEDDRPGRLDWSGWFGELGVEASHISPAIKFNSHPLLIQAACEGQGISLGWRLLTDDLIASGRLVRPIDAEVRTRNAFYFVDIPGRHSDAIGCFKDWLFETVGELSRPHDEVGRSVA
jgi:LysR family transcriptional regulator, glycine cleavage system transcriptional activator